ncbi:MAG: response regulator [Candidatus Omnitrophota bacterium]
MKRILIFDTEDMQYLYRPMFKGKEDEYEIEFEEKGLAAFKRLKEASPDLVILEILMEPMNGQKFYSLVRSDPEIGKVPILVVSVLSPESLRHLKKFNEIEVLQKPVSEEQLFNKIEKMIAK